jgi:hypothetical protein
MTLVGRQLPWHEGLQKGTLVPQEWQMTFGVALKEQVSLQVLLLLVVEKLCARKTANWFAALQVWLAESVFVVIFAANFGGKKKFVWTEAD